MIDAYIGGGQLFFKAEGAAEYTELFGVESAEITRSTEKAELYDHSCGTKKVAKKATKSEAVTIKFKTTNISAEMLAMFVGGTITDSVTHTDTEAGWVAQTSQKIEAGTQVDLVGALKFVHCTGADKDLILDIPKAMVSADGSLALQAEDFASLEFEGEVFRDSAADPYYTFYKKA